MERRASGPDELPRHYHGEPRPALQRDVIVVLVAGMLV